MFLISLDFELLWGDLQAWTVEGYGRSHVAQVREVISRMLQLFECYQVKATFATVGLVMEDLSSAQQDKVTIRREDADLYFAPDVVEQLKASPWVEIGSQTYSHYVCCRGPQENERFEADLRKAVEVATKHGLQLQSLVFPRNAVITEYLPICERMGFTCYRGNPQRYYGATRTIVGRYKNKLCRLVDAYINIGGDTSYVLERVEAGMQNIPASRFLRPYSRCLSFLEPLRFRRIRREMEHAARRGEVYHLWWHPHNFGADMNENLAFLEKILKTYQQLHEQYGMVSRTMKELAQS